MDDDRQWAIDEGAVDDGGVRSAMLDGLYTPLGHFAIRDLALGLVLGYESPMKK